MAPRKQRRSDRVAENSTSCRPTESTANDATIIRVSNPSSQVASSAFSRPKLQAFKGKNDYISIDFWISLYDNKTNFLRWNDEMKVSFLDEYLEDDALAWFAQACMGKNWSEVVEMMKKRFNKPLSQPIIDFIDLKYDLEKGFHEYFEEMQILAQRAQLSDERNHIIPVMIHGLPNAMKSYFVTSTPVDITDFYQTGLKAERATAPTLKRKAAEEKSSDEQGNKKSKPNIKKKPPNPCFICVKRGFSNRYHWASDCHFKSDVEKKDGQNHGSKTDPKKQPNNDRLN